MSTILIADTDPRTIDLLQQILSEDIPDVAVDVSTSAEDLSRKRKISTYDTIAVNPLLLHSYRSEKHNDDRYVLTPVLLTASREERELASTYLETDAFDLIVKPIVREEAVRSVRVALWQNALLRLLASKERATQRFRQHMEAFPHARKMEEEFESKLAAYERTFQALTTSLQHLIDRVEEDSLFEMAGHLESMTRKRALDRLFRMSDNGRTH
jgi:DNA-binding NtrC family response regulator